MFDSKKYILSLSKDYLRLEVIAGAIKPYVELTKEYSWNDENLSEVLLKVKQEYGSNYRLLLSDEFVYMTSLVIPADLSDEAQYIKTKAQEIIPESLDETIWDFKEVLSITNDKKEEKVVQVIALVNHRHNKAFMAFNEAALQIEAIEPIAYALGRLYTKEVGPIVILYQGEEPLQMVVNKGLVLETQVLKTPFSASKVQDLINFVQERFNLSPKKIFCSQNITEISEESFKTTDIALVKAELDPFVGLALKKDVEGKDEEVLNLDISKLQKNADTTDVQVVSKDADKENEDVTPVQEISEQTLKKSHNVTLLVVLLFVLLGGLAGLYYYQNYSDSQSTKTVVPTPVITNTAVTPAIVTTASSAAQVNYTISVLNGSNKTGEAGKISELLKENDIDVAEVGNADTRDYANTVVRTKENVSEEFNAKLDKILEDRYTNIKHEKLNNDDEKDIIIIIGQE